MGLLVLLSLLSIALVADEVVLKNGDIMRGKIRRHTYSEVVIDHNNLGRMFIPMAEIKDVRSAEDPNAPPSFFKRARQNGWSFTFDLSLQTMTGNKDEQALRTALGLGCEKKRTSFELKSSLYYRQKKGVVTDRKGDTRYEQRFFREDSKLYSFGVGLFDHDAFKSWEQRLSGYGGAGYSWVKTQKVVFETGGGLGLRKEYGSINDNTKFEGIAALGFTWSVSQRQKVETRFFYAPVLTDFEDYRTRGSLEWRLVLSRDVNVSLLVGMLHEFQSVVNPGDAKEDIRVYTGLQMKL